MGGGFQRKKEDFTCAHCGHSVVGTGYTNHCPKCLWSKHVDVDPGDRLAECGGLMKPLRLVNEKGEFVITQKCQMCGHERRNRLSREDDAVEAIRVTTPE